MHDGVHHHAIPKTKRPAHGALAGEQRARWRDRQCARWLARIPHNRRASPQYTLSEVDWKMVLFHIIGLSMNAGVRRARARTHTHIPMEGPVSFQPRPDSNGNDPVVIPV